MIEWGAAVAAFFGGGGVIVIAVVWGLKNLDKVERIAGLLFRALNWVHGRWVYRNIATNIQARSISTANGSRDRSKGFCPVQ